MRRKVARRLKSWARAFENMSSGDIVPEECPNHLLHFVKFWLRSLLEFLD
jgi:hypothetical protein